MREPRPVWTTRPEGPPSPARLSRLLAELDRLPAEQEADLAEQLRKVRAKRRELAAAGLRAGHAPIIHRPVKEVGTATGPGRAPARPPLR
jgi:hypothetical protein